MDPHLLFAIFALLVGVASLWYTAHCLRQIERQILRKENEK